MSRKSAVFALAVTLVVVISADLATRRLASNSVPRQVIRTITSSPERIDVLGIGNSLMSAGFDPAAVEKTCEVAGHRCTAVNGALGATGLIEHLVLARLALRGHSIGTLVYGFFDQELASSVVEKNSELIGNPNVLYYLEPDLTLRYARFDSLDRLLFRVYGSSALLRDRGAIWEKVEKLRRAMASVGMPAQNTNRFGRAADFAFLEKTDSHAFALSCENVIRSNRFLGDPAEALFQQARQHGAKVLVVEMPMHPEHLKRFYSQPIWNEFRSKTREAVERAGGLYLNASTWIPNEQMFDDHLHLSRVGARNFSQRLAEYLLRNSF